MQAQAVECTEGPLLILAGAGSGKTTVLINRIINILRLGLARPWQILAITFTNKAAGELKDRLEAKLGAESREVWALTFHSACVRILRRECRFLGYDESFSIYDTNDSLSLIKHILKDLDYDEKFFVPRTLLSQISKQKDAAVLPARFEADAQKSGDLYKIRLAKIYSEYSARLKAANAMDFDDLILNTVLILQQNEEARLYWQRRFKYILIDEYQDTNHLQYLLASLLCNEERNICVVGDDNQSIYKFRGATIENILSFENEYPGCTVIKLEQNYRSTGHILEAANEVISHNINRKEKNLWTQRGEGDLIELYVADNEHDEAQYVASNIMAGYSKGMSFSDFAVLYRMNAQSNNLEYAFKRLAVPYRIVGGMRFFDRAEVKDVLSYLNVIQAPSDNLRLERIINNPPRGIGKTSVEKALEISFKEGCSLFEIIKHADLYPELSRPAMRMREFGELIEYLREFSFNNSPEYLFDELLEKTGYLRMYEEKKDPESEAKAENIKEIRTSIISFMEENEDRSLEAYLANVALYTDLDNYDENADCVTLMTLHASKGLEFPAVFIVGMEESIFPGMKAIGEAEEMEEERRLCYVGITRAKSNLKLVCAKHRMLFGKTNSNRVSRFVDEISPEHIKKNIPKGYGFSEKSIYEKENAVREKKPAFTPNFAPKKAELSSNAVFNVGDLVKHKAFGEGVVIKSTPMSNDALLEVSFPSVGNKKLMMRAAGKFMEKLPGE